MKPSIRARFTGWSAGMMALTLALFSVSILWLNARQGRAQFDAELTSVGAAMERMLGEEIEESRSLQRAAEETGSAMAVPGLATAILDAGGTPLVAQWHGFVAPSLPTLVDPSGAARVTTVAQGTGPWRVFTHRQTSPYGDGVVLVAEPLERLQRQQALLQRTLLVATPAIVALVALASWAVASSALRPVRVMALQAAVLTAGSPDLRLDGETSADELGQLARAFNYLLARLGTSLRRQQQFMADASHELRTPVSVIRTAAEVTLDRTERDAAEYREALTIVLEQSLRLGRMVDDMLVLGRADAGGYSLVRSAVSLNDIVSECVRAATVIAGPRQVRVIAELQPKVSMLADPALLQRLVVNLLDNAVQHTPPQGVVSVTLTATDREVALTVSDSGRGVPREERERIFERFVRLDAARGSESGAGLGLAIARWIAQIHGGTLVVADQAAVGSAFVARWPLTPSATLEH